MRKRARQDSNLRSLAPEASAISTSPRALVTPGRLAVSVRRLATMDGVSTLARGIEAETEVLPALTRVGVSVAVPWGDGHAYDLLADLGDRIVRVQVKSGRLRDGVVRFNGWSTDHGAGRRSYAGPAGVLAVHCRELDEVYVLDVDGLPQQASFLRVAPAKYDQRSGVRLAADATLARWLERHRR
jgi:hypothetical protein